MTQDKSRQQDDFITVSGDIDVNAIMDSIKKNIAARKESGILKQIEIDEIEDMELLPLPDFLEIPNVYAPHLYPGHPKEEFVPFHIDPEIESGKIKGFLARIRGLFMPFIRFMIRPLRSDLQNLTVELHNQNKEQVHDLKQLVPLTYQSKEYIKLLHNTINNMIVESSKLKIEEELLKTKVKVLEDKIEFLENRQRAIEKKIF